MYKRQALTTTFSVIGRIVGSLSDVQQIETKNGKALLTFRYLLGDHTGVVEVTQVGPSSHSVLQQVKELQDEVVVLNKAGWNEPRKQLQHSQLTVLERAHASQAVDDVKFPIYDDFNDLPRLPAWTRVSVDAFLCDPGSSVLAEQGGRNTKGWQRDCTICNIRAQGVRLRVVHPHEDDLDYFTEGLPLKIQYGKTFTGGIYLDLSESCLSSD